MILPDLRSIQSVEYFSKTAFISFQMHLRDRTIMKLSLYFL